MFFFKLALLFSVLICVAIWSIGAKIFSQENQNNLGHLIAQYSNLNKTIGIYTLCITLQILLVKFCIPGHTFFVIIMSYQLGNFKVAF